VFDGLWILFIGVLVVKIMAVMVEHLGGNYVPDPLMQPVVQVPAGSSHSFRRTTDLVLLLFHTWGKRSYLYVLRVPFTVKIHLNFPVNFRTSFSLFSSKR
jgi:hypothetical protein